MKPQRILVVLIPLTLGLFGTACLAADKPNIILVLTDDQGYGNPVLKPPSLDRFHRESIRFADFHVAPMCTPTRGQLLTGRDALANGTG